MNKLINLSHSALVKIFEGLDINVNSVTKKQPLILFAFRGAVPTKPITTWTKSIGLKIAKPDYLHMRCTLGIWDRDQKRIFVAIGSTIPFKDNVVKAAAREGKLKGKGTNQLEPGFYSDLTKGEHLQGKLNGHEALRQTASRFYRRSLTGIPYSKNSPLFFGNPYDNLHCGWNLKGKKKGFSSSGCIVIAGRPYCHRHEKPEANQGAWKIFYDLIYGATQKQFSLLLVPADWLTKILSPQSLKPLIYGSTGETVKALQKSLWMLGHYKGPVHGRLDAQTYKAWEKLKTLKHHL